MSNRPCRDNVTITPESDFTGFVWNIDILRGITSPGRQPAFRSSIVAVGFTNCELLLLMVVVLPFDPADEEFEFVFAFDLVLRIVGQTIEGAWDCVGVVCEPWDV